MNHKLLYHVESIKRLEPITLTIDLTNKCNLHCEFCLVKNMDRNQEEISLDKIKYVVDHLPSIKSIEVGNGEAILYHDFKNFVDYIYEKNIKLGICSNGILLHGLPKDTLKKITWTVIGCTTIVDKELNIKFNDLPFKCNFLYIFHKNTPSNIIELLTKFEKKNRCNGYFQLRLDFFADNETKQKFNNIEYIEGIEKISKLELRNSRKGICYYAKLKPYLMSDGYFYPCCKENDQRDYSKAYQICKWNEIDKLLTSKTLVNCNCGRYKSQKCLDNFFIDKDVEFIK